MQAQLGRWTFSRQLDIPWFDNTSIFFNQKLITFKRLFSHAFELNKELVYVNIKDKNCTHGLANRRLLGKSIPTNIWCKRWNLNPWPCKLFLRFWGLEKPPNKEWKIEMGSMAIANLFFIISKRTGLRKIAFLHWLYSNF